MNKLFVKPFVLFSILLFVVVSMNKTNAEANNSSKIVWTNELSMDQGFHLKWIYDDPEWLTMEMSAPATGYVAIGFSPYGGMKDSDIILGWVDSTGKAHIKDMYGIGNTKPIEDKVQNCELLSGEESDNITTIRFRRKWNTCDNDNEHDRPIGKETIRLIWAYNQKDPELADDDGVFRLRPSYHGSLRGSQPTYLRRALATQTELPDDYPEKFPNVKFWDVQSNNSISAEDQVFFCSIVKFPASKMKKHHMIGHRPLMDPEMKPFIHHMLMFECHVPSSDGTTENIFEKYVGSPAHRCYTQSTPPEWLKYCVDMPILMTMGSNGTMLPENVGFPLGEDYNGTTYFLFQIHYTNRQLKSFTDTTGIRTFYTDNLRQHDQGSMDIGHKNISTICGSSKV